MPSVTATMPHAIPDRDRVADATTSRINEGDLAVQSPDGKLIVRGASLANNRCCTTLLPGQRLECRSMLTGLSGNTYPAHGKRKRTANQRLDCWVARVAGGLSNFR